MPEVSQEESTLSAEGQAALKLMRQILDIVPESGEFPVKIVHRVVGEVLLATGNELRAVESAFAKNATDVGANPAEVDVLNPGVFRLLMCAGALAVALEGLPDDSIRTRAYRAGRAVGEFYTQRIATNLAAAVAEPPKTA